MKELIKMARSVVFCFCIIAGGLYGNVWAGEVSEFELTDGSTIRGEIVSYSSGTYTVKSKSMGTVKIDESNVQVIRVKSGDSPAGELSGASLNSEAQALQQLMMSDEHLLNSVLALQNDPEVQEILNDPAIVRAVNSGNIDALLSNPKFMQLLVNPRIQAITRDVVEEMSENAE
jgi:hypothetical protein